MLSVVVSDACLHILSSLFFFLMIRRPPRSTLFPSRRSSDLARRPAHGQGSCPGDDGAAHLTRSEEHTSELQSRGHLVCRLLLEKKNNRLNAPQNKKRENKQRERDNMGSKSTNTLAAATEQTA